MVTVTERYSADFPVRRTPEHGEMTADCTAEDTDKKEVNDRYAAGRTFII